MANNELRLEELSREQILDLADASGRKLGFLLATSSLDDEIKEAILGILEFATPAQIDLLTQMLEDGYLNANNQGLNDFLRSELEEIKKDSAAQEEILEKATLEKISKLKI